MATSDISLTSLRLAMARTQAMHREIVMSEEGKEASIHGHPRGAIFAAAYSTGGAECNPQIPVNGGYGGARGLGRCHRQGVGERKRHLAKNIRKALRTKYASWSNRSVVGAALRRGASSVLI